MRTTSILSKVLLVLTFIAGNIQAQNFNWEVVSSTVECRDALIENDTVWVASSGGFIKFMKNGTCLRVYTAKDGLSQTDCYCISKDSRGNKYIGTARFLSKFNGSRFETIESNPGGASKVLGVSAVYVKSNDRVLFYTADGLSEYDGTQVVTTKINLSYMGIPTVFDKTGNLWFVSTSGKLSSTADGVTINEMNKGLNALNNAYFFMAAKLSFANDNTPYLNFPNQSVLRMNTAKWDTLSLKLTNLAFDPQGNFITVRNDSIVYYNANTVSLKVKLNYKFPVWNGYMPATFNKIVDNGQFSWILSSAGCLKSDRTSVTKHLPESVCPGKITGLAVENSGNIWACSTDAISSRINGVWKIFSYSETGNIYGGANWANVDTENKKWFGGYGGGLLCYNDQVWTIFNSGNTPALTSSDFICSLFSATKKWFGTSDKGIFVLNGTTWTNISTTNGLPSNYIYSLAADASGNIWCATDKGVALYKNGVWTTVNTLKTYLVYIDSQNRVWTGHDGYVQYFDGTSWKSVSDYITPRSATFRLGFGSVQFLAAKEDSFAKVWFSYGMSSMGGYFYFDGVNMIDPDPDNITYVQAPMKSVMMDKQNRIWLGAVGCTVIDQSVSGINNPYSPSHHSVYPTQCMDLLTITSENQDRKMITILDYSGRQIYSSCFEGTTFKLNVSKFIKGLYLISIRDNHSNETYKFLKK